MRSSTFNRGYWFNMRDQSVDAAPPSHDLISARVAGWAAALRHAVAATPASRLIPFSIHARSGPQRLGEGRLIRVGDAAHAMEPNLGQGAWTPTRSARLIAACSARRAGVAPGYAYSPALKSSGIAWTASTLDQSLQGPQKMVKGAKMYFAVPNPGDRAAIIAYLKATSNK